MKLLFTALTIAAAFIYGCGNSEGAKSSHNTTQYNKDGSIKAIWDVPTLINGTIEDATAKLGKGAEQENPNLAENTQTWHNGDYFLILDYKTSTRRVLGAFIGKQRTLSDWHALEYIGNLTNTNLRINPVKSLQDPTEYTGIEIKKW